MPKLEKIHIWVSPLTKKVYIGTGKIVNGLFEANSKIDRTNEFIGTLIQFLKEYGGEVEVVETTEQGMQKKYCIKLEEADALRDCSKCKHFEDRGPEYSCKYLREGKVVFQSDSTDTAESCAALPPHQQRYCKLSDITAFLDIRVEDDVTGADVPELVRQGRWEEVRTHCAKDVETTYHLFRRLQELALHNLQVRYNLGPLQVVEVERP